MRVQASKHSDTREAFGKFPPFSFTTNKSWVLGGPRRWLTEDSRAIQVCLGNV